MLTADIELTMDVVTGFLTRYAHRITDNFEIVVRCNETGTSYYRPDRELIVVGEVDEENLNLTHAKATTLHECGHALYTPRGLLGVLRKLRPGVKLLWNLLEDGRIELALMNSVTGAPELLTLMNEEDHRRARGKAKSSWEMLWYCLWELAKMGKVRTRVTGPRDGVLTRDEIKARVEKARPIIARARYEADPWAVVGHAQELYELVKDMFREVSVLLPEDPQLFGDGDRQAPGITVDIGGGSMPGGRRGVQVIEADPGALAEEEDRLRREIEKEVRERSGAADEAGRDMESKARKSLTAYQSDQRFLAFDGTVEVHGTEADHAQYEALLVEVRPVVRRLVRSLRQIAVREAASDISRGSRSGTVDPHLAYRALLGDRDVFRRTCLREDIFPVVSVLVDESGSMSSAGRYIHARKATVAVHEALSRLGVSHAVNGFTSNGMRHTHHVYPYVRFGEKRSRSRSARLAGIRSRDCNRDGLALKIAGDGLLAQPGARKMLIVISDGLPNAFHYRGKPAVEDARRVVQGLERAGCFVFCLYIGEVFDNSVDRIYPRYAFVERLEGLPGQLGGVIRDYTRASLARGG